MLTPFVDALCRRLFHGLGNLGYYSRAPQSKTITFLKIKSTFAWKQSETQEQMFEIDVSTSP